jgi:glyoxylase I family protein
MADGAICGLCAYGLENCGDRGCEPFLRHSRAVSREDSKAEIPTNLHGDLGVTFDGRSLDMQINNVLASLPVNDLGVSRAWYEKLFGRAPDTSPMPTLVEWRFAGGGSLQVYTGPDRAGGGSCTLAITDIDATIDGLKNLGIDPGKLIDGARQRWS